MPVIPHAHWLFDSVGLVLRRDAASFTDTALQWEMTSAEACQHISAIGQFYAEDGAGILPRPLVCALLGGDPLSEPEDVDRLLDVITAFQMVAEISTTGGWVVDEVQADEVIAALPGRVHALRLQTSSSMLTADRLKQVDIMLESCRSHGITVDVHAGVGPGRPFPRALLSLDVVNRAASFVHVDPDSEAPHACGADAQDPGIWLSGPTRLRCAEKFGFYVTPGGAVYPCMSGIGLPGLQIGDLSAQPMRAIVASAAEDVELARLRWDGPAHLAPAAGSGRYLDNCDFHRQLLLGSSSGADSG